MLVHVRLVGGTGESDPLRAPLPTYQLQSVDQAAGTAVVEIPEADLPPHPDFLTDPAEPEMSARRLPPRLSRQHYAAWYRHLDERYAEHAGEFRPQVVEVPPSVPA